MVPWLFFLVHALPPATRAAGWPAAWAGLDALEALGLLTTGMALIRRCTWLCLPAAITATLLIVDAWFDITTSASVAMAVFPELPAAVLCAVLAVRTVPCSAPRDSGPLPSPPSSATVRPVRPQEAEGVRPERGRVAGLLDLLEDVLHAV
jgi:hypothetical protein